MTSNLRFTEPVALRLIGICKSCKKAAFGYLTGGTGPFTCYSCGGKAKGTQTPAAMPGNAVRYEYYFTTTSNTTSTKDNPGDSI